MSLDDARPICESFVRIRRPHASHRGVMRLALALGLTAGLIVLASGCTNQYAGRVEVNGTAKLKGQPIKSGTVSFEPAGGQDTRATATIDDGAYKIPRASGLKPGKYLIRVSAGDGKTAVNPVDA